MSGNNFFHNMSKTAFYFLVICDIDIGIYIWYNLYIKNGMQPFYFAN